MSAISELTQDEIRNFVIPAHGDLDTVKRLLAENPALLNAKYEDWNETPLGAASHVGARLVAEYLLAAGAPLTICTAAMLGDRGVVAQFLAADPTQAQATGAHGIPVLTHAALSGDTAIAELLIQQGGAAGASDGLVLAAERGHRDMVAWLLAHGADIATLDWQGKTALQLATEQGHEETAALLRQHSASV